MQTQPEFVCPNNAATSQHFDPDVPLSCRLSLQCSVHAEMEQPGRGYDDGLEYDRPYKSGYKFQRR